MLYGGIIAYIVFHGEISEMSAYIALLACITELALGPFGPQSSLSSPGWLLEASAKLWEALGALLALLEMAPKSLQNGLQVAPKWLKNRSWSILECSWSSLGSLEASWMPCGGLLERSWEPLGQLWGALGEVWGASGDNF